MSENRTHNVSAVIGVDIGGTKIAAGIVTKNGDALHVQTTRTPSKQGASAILATVADLSRQLIGIAQRERIEIKAVGVGAGGQIDVLTGRVCYATDVIPGWAGANIVSVLEQELCLPVRADNDVNVLALGEHKFGAARTYHNVLFVAVGTGVGGALILNNQLVHGASSSAGEIAHLLVDYRGERICGCGQPGHLEAYASGPSIASRYQELAGLEIACELPNVFTNACQGDQLALLAIEEGALILGKALVGVLAVLDPQALVIGGGVTQLGDMWWQPLLKAIRANPLPGPAQIPVHLAALGQHAAVIGSGALGYENLP